MKRKVLVVATSSRTKGGITSVIKSYQEGDVWLKFHCNWVETHIDRNFIWKLIYCILGYCKFVMLIPFYDIAHFHISEIKTLQRKYPLLLLTKLWRKKVIIHFHNNHFLLNSSRKDREYKLYKSAFYKADRILVVTDYWKRWIMNNFNITKNVEVIYNSAPNISVHENRVERKKTILYAGVITEMKGCYDLLKAFSLISFKYPDWSLEFAGAGDIDIMKKTANDLNILNKVSFLGWITGDDKEIIFKSASIFVLPSHAEGFPMVILEAWKYETPILTTRVGGIPDIVIDGENASLFDAGDINALSSKLSYMIENKVFLEKISRNGLKLVNSRYSRSVINKQLEEIYSEI